MALRQLKEKLEDEEVECPPESCHYFIPRCKQEKLITEDVIRNVIRDEFPELNDAKVEAYVQKASHSARQLFATLAYVGRPREICTFLDEGIIDDNLPLRRRPQDFNDEDKASLWILEGRADEGQRRIHINALDKWSWKDRKNFCNAQRLMTAPFFRKRGEYYLDDNVVLPFMNPRFEQKKEEGRRGGYSEIWIRRPFASHHDFWSPSDVNVPFCSRPQT